MCIIWQLVMGVVTVVILMSVSQVESDHGGSHYCPRNYTVSVVKTRYYTYRCVYWYHHWRCTGSLRYYAAETRTDITSCCAGYRGVSCDIPICSNCQNNAVCLSPPNNCYCRPGSSGTTCELKYCSASNDCYPGTCFDGGSSCRCASGFSGSSCNIMQEGGNFRSCDVNLETTTNGEAQTTLTATCGTRDPVEYTYWANTANLDYLVTNADLLYQNHDDMPPIPSEYMIQANFGLVQSYTMALLKSNGGTTRANHTIMCEPPVAAGQSPPSLDNPHQSMNCQNIRFRWPTSITHRDKLELELFSKTGGFKQYKDPTTNVLATRNYTGGTTSQKVHINFDLEAPLHCSESSSCEDEFTVPSSWIPDITNETNPTIYWAGWNDTDSGIKDYRYTVYSMEIQNNQLTETTPYMLQERLTLLNDTPVIELKFRGMYSVIVEVYDFAGNFRKTRSVVLFDDTSKIETESNNPISIAEVDSWDSAFWFTQAGSAPIQITWENHFINRFLHDNDMLVEVKPMADVMDDNSGNRTIQAINNVQGVVKFEATYNKDASGGISTTPTHSYEDLGLEQAYEITAQRSDGETIMVFIRATDPIGNNKEETVKIHTDATPATYLEGLSTLQVNAAGRDSDQPYVSGLSLNLLDVNSGIRNMSYNVVDTTTGTDVLVYTDAQIGQRHPTYTQNDECVSSSECYCIPAGPCYNLNQVFEIDHCQLTELAGHSFRFDFTAVNGAGLQTTDSFDIGILDGLSGIGLYPPVQELRLIDANEFTTKVALAWYLLPACYEVTGFRIIFIDGQTRRELEISEDKVTYEVADLSPGSLYSVDLIVLYEGGKQSPQANIAFSTPDDGGSGGEGFGVGSILGIVIGAILLILLGAVIILLVVRYQQNKHPVPDIVRETTTRVRNRLSRLSRYHHDDEPDMSFNNLQKGAAYGVNNNTYTGTHEEEGAIGGKQVAFNVAYGDDEDEDIYIYGNMETDPKAHWKVSDDKLVMDGALPGAKGRFADLKLATLQDKNGKNTVVAKMNKLNANEEDRLLMVAKMNFYATDVMSHEYLVNFIAAIPPPQGPIMLFEYCPEGKLVDWLQSHPNMTDDVEDNLISFTVQISSAMTHLHTSSLLHRRLGARNVLLKNNAKNQLVAKVTGFGPMKGEQDGNDSKSKDRVPIKWMAPEQFEKSPSVKRLYTDHTDVWSYGITLHEIFNKGEAPYSDMKSGDVKEKVRNGYRLPKGNNCPDFIYEIMTQCWDAKPDNRPGFASIECDLKKFYEGQGGGEEYYYDNHTKYTK